MDEREDWTGRSAAADDRNPRPGGAGEAGRLATGNANGRSEIAHGTGLASVRLP